MADPSPHKPANPLTQALGRVPSGLYILTVRDQDRATGMLASWVQQAGFDPPALTVALATKRVVTEWVAKSGRFTLNQLPVGSKALIRHFARSFEPGAPAFEGVALRPGVGQAGPVLDLAMAYLDAEVIGEIASGDHRIFLARVVGGALLDAAAEPFLHVRASGSHY